MPSKGCSNNWQPKYLNSPFFILTIMSLVRLKIKGI
ncbi:MAG: hypothetical protein ACI9SG_001615, partial [Maribacter sp.]